METRSGSSNCSLQFETKNLRLNNREKTLAVVILAALLVGAWLPERIIVSTSPSLEHRIFFLTRANSEIKLGDYLVFRHKDSDFVQKGLDPANDRMIKKVGCRPGNILSTDVERNYFCGHKLLGVALKKDSKGRSLPLFQFSGPVPEDSYFMVGTNPRSFDSKYFGFVHANDILYKALPIW
ncbi:S26 family signal peptidase [Desulfoprunum benzoelyticum]|jgi:type IV secretory pathway protease TraF|uniref:Type IV secretory pathway protease TraF n=1 Tax=Desulfoprunum benzoelyticum TaxID=1506996 RepID=A0A840UQ96_9BACT|nr:S26 family signal peptidase [Desulfoprunum benzoelyticum]MBB5348407.1 type IV secretory pathway protease TraF [Desulfoprunum benzoelyticum]MBM9528735.1 S26 family signal peptidase [Desulfoprunum benzoelyticum]